MCMFILVVDECSPKHQRAQSMSVTPHRGSDCPTVPRVALPHYKMWQKRLITYNTVLLRKTFGEEKTVGCRCMLILYSIGHKHFKKIAVLCWLQSKSLLGMPFGSIFYIPQVPIRPKKVCIYF